MKINFTTKYNRDDYIIFVLETSGTKMDDEIVEYAFVKYKNGVISDKITSYVLPTTTNNVVKKEYSKGFEINKHTDQIVEFIKGKSLVTHNARFLTTYLKNVMGDYDLELDIIDVIDKLKERYTLERYNLSYLLKHFNIKQLPETTINKCIAIKEILDNIE